MSTDLALHSRIKTMQEVFSYMLSDYETLFRNKVYYNMDFSLLFPYLFPNSTSAIPHFIASGKKIFSMLSKLNSVDLNFKLVFTGASLWELIDAIDHQVFFWKNKRESKTERANLEKIREEIASPEVSLDRAKDIIIDKGYTLREIEVLTKKGYSKHITQPIKKIEQLFKTDSILNGVGEFIQTSEVLENGYREDFEFVYNNMLKKRKERSRTRGKSAKEFHYKVDASNIALCNSYNSNNSNMLNFTTIMSLSYIDEKLLKDAHTRKLNGRHPLVPYCFVSAKLLQNNYYFSNLHDFIKEGLIYADNVNKIMEKRQNVENMTQMEKNKLADFLGYFISPLMNPDEPNEDLLKNKEILIDILKKAKHLDEKYEEAEETLKAHGPKLTSYASDLLKDDLVSGVDLDNDVIVNKLRKRYCH